MEQRISREEIGLQHIINNNSECSLIPNTTMTTEKEKTMPPVKNKIWELNIGNIITMLVIIVTMSISYAKTEERVNTQAEINRLNFEIINKAIIRIENNIDEIQTVLGGSNYPLRDERIAQLFRELEEIKKQMK